MAETETPEPNEDSNMARLRELAKQGKDLPDVQAQLAEAQAALAQVERTNAFLEAGIDPKDPKAKYFVKGYDGDLTVEAIQAEAAQSGITAQVQSQAPNPAGSNIDEAMSGGDIPKPNADGQLPKNLADSLAKVRNAKGMQEWELAFAEAAAVNPEGSAMAEDLGFAIADAADITNVPRLMPMFGTNAKR